MPGWRLPLVGALALTLGLAPVQPLMAAPAALPATVAKAQAGSAVTEVGRWRRHRHHHHHHGGGFAVGLGIGIIGAMIAAEAARSRDRAYYDDVDPRELCAREFRSFEWDTGRYTTYNGERRLCPYLR